MIVVLVVKKIKIMLYLKQNMFVFVLLIFSFGIVFGQFFVEGECFMSKGVYNSFLVDF